MKIVLPFGVFLLACGTSLHAKKFEDYFVAPANKVANKSHVEHTADWWQWTESMPEKLSPVRDLTGKRCHIGQSGKVWFLAGGYGTSKIHRTCKIPAGKYIFFPVISMLSYPLKGGRMTCAESKRSAAINNDKLASINVSLNGMSLSNPTSTRLVSKECFDLAGRVPASRKSYRVYPSASDGYWVMLKPLPKGTHTLKFQGRYNRDNSKYGKMVQDIEYKIIVK